MAGKFKADTQEIRNKKKEIDQLVSECQEIKMKVSQEPSEGKGPVVNKLEEIEASIQTAWDSLIMLMSNTAAYLEEIAKTYDSSDQKQANEINRK